MTCTNQVRLLIFILLVWHAEANSRSIKRTTFLNIKELTISIWPAILTRNRGAHSRCSEPWIPAWSACVQSWIQRGIKTNVYFSTFLQYSCMSREILMPSSLCPSECDNVNVNPQPHKSCSLIVTKIPIFSTSSYWIWSEGIHIIAFICFVVVIVVKFSLKLLK